MSALLSVDELVVQYRGPRRSLVPAVRGVSLTIDAGTTLGLVGESGSGKSTIGRAILGMTPVSSGRLMFDGEDITVADRRRRRALSSDLRVVFQDPYGSLNPARTIGQTLAESVRSQRLPRIEVDRLIRTSLGRVGLPPQAATRYPSRFSGGQRQRIAIARALMTSPRLLICDEAVSALDLSVQAHVLNLLRELQQELGLAQLFISHDLSVVRHVSDNVAVLYRGEIVEYGPAHEVYSRPKHPYTRRLLAAAPIPDPQSQERNRRAMMETR